MPSERTLVRVGVGVIALHVVDDSFLQPQPGTSAGDHLLGGLVPLAVLALAAVAYPRLRAGWRAVVALLLGVFGLGTASEAWYYTREVGASGQPFAVVEEGRAVGQVGRAEVMAVLVEARP